MLIEIITSYSHSISIVSSTFDILLFLSSQCARRAAASPVAVLRGPLKKAGVMRMIDSIYSAYDNDEAMSTTDYVRLSELLKAESSTSEPTSSLRIELMKKARQLESNLGLRSRCAGRA